METRVTEPTAEAGHLLVVDDDREIRDLLSRFLTDHGYVVSTGRDHRDMAAALGSERFDLVILDVMLPGKNGLDICRDLRAGSSMPILMLTAMGEETDRVVGLEMGADDYLSKPFSPRELLARIRAVLRRAPSRRQPLRPASGRLRRFAGWTLDLARRRLEAPDGVIIGLTSGEFELLAAFAEHPGHVLSRDQLLDLARGRDAMPYDRSIDVQVSRVRRKIEADPRSPEVIVTVRGGGYLFTPEVECA